MKLDSDRVYDALVRSGEEWADKDAAASLLEENKNSVLARLKNLSVSKSDAARKDDALCHSDFLEHLELMIEARKVAIKAKVRYDSAKTLAEMRRSEESTRRAEMTMR